MDDAKTYDPTPQRRQRAAADGQVARSHDLSAMAVPLAGLGCLFLMGSQLVEWLAIMTTRHLQHVELRLDANGLVHHLTHLAAGLAGLLLPVFGLMVVCAIVVELMQVGVRFSATRLAPDLNRINPASGFGRIFSLDALARSTLAACKVGVVAGVLYLSLREHLEYLVSLPDSSPSVIAVETGTFVIWTALKSAAALFIVACVDYLYRWWKHEQDLKMTSEELREEFRELRGDPQVAARRRALQAGSPATPTSAT